MRDRDVGDRDEPAAAAEGVALHPHDDRRGARIDRLQHLPQPPRVLDVLLVGEVDRGAHPLNVRAGGEALSLAREDDHSRVPDVGESLGQLRDQLGVERIAPVGPRDGDPQDRPFVLGAERAHRPQLKVVAVLKGTLAAAVTPLRDGGSRLDENAFGPLVDFLAAGGLDGIFALGSTGEGILLDGEERRRTAELFVEAADGRLDVAVHCGAQTTEETVALAGHAASSGADAVAVIAPPYYRLDEEALLAHFGAAARACASLPFYVYELAAASGYAVPVSVVERLRTEVPNLAGMKVSDSPWEAFEPYLIEGLDVFVGPETLIERGLEAGAVGAVSALATAFPERVAKRDGDLGKLREGIERFPRHAALKRVLASRGVRVREDVRAPLRQLSVEERRELDAWLESL